MDINDFSHDEKVALVGLVEFLVESDRSASDEEVAQIHSIAAALGAKTYRELANEVDRRISGEEGLREFLRRVERQEVRELILEQAIEAAIPDGMRGREGEILTWLADEWNVEIDFPST